MYLGLRIHDNVSSILLLRHLRYWRRRRSSLGRGCYTRQLHGILLCKYQGSNGVLQIIFRCIQKSFLRCKYQFHHQRCQG